MTSGGRSFLTLRLAAIPYYASQHTIGNANGSLPVRHMDQQVACIQLDISGRQHVRVCPCQLTRFLEAIISELFTKRKDH